MRLLSLCLLIASGGCSTDIAFLGPDVGAIGYGPMRPIGDGGTMTVQIQRLDDGDDAIHLLEDFDARVSGDVALVEVTSGEVTLRATGTGGGVLDILETGGNMIDSTAIETASIDAVRMVTSDTQSPELSDDRSDHYLYARLYTADGTIAVDQTMTLSSSTPGVTAEQLEWDTLRLSIAPGVTSVTIDIEADSVTALEVLPVSP
jgi:hypothetical protein